MLRAGKKLLVELEPEGRRAVADLQAASGQHQQQQGELGGLPAAPAEPQDGQAVPSSLLRGGEGKRGWGGGMVRWGWVRVHSAGAYPLQGYR